VIPVPALRRRLIGVLRQRLHRRNGKASVRNAIGQIGLDALVARFARLHRLLAAVPDRVVVENVCFEVAVGDAEIPRLRLPRIVEDVPFDPVAAHHRAVWQDRLLGRHRHAAHLLPLGILDQPVIGFQHFRLAVSEKHSIRVVGPALQRNPVRRAEPLGVRIGTTVFGEDIVVDMVLARVVQVHRAHLAALDNVAVHVEPAARLVQVDAPGEDEELAVVVESDAVRAVVIADRRPTAGPAAAVGAAGVFHFEVAVADPKIATADGAVVAAADRDAGAREIAQIVDQRSLDDPMGTVRQPDGLGFGQRIGEDRYACGQSDDAFLRAIQEMGKEITVGFSGERQGASLRFFGGSGTGG
jgi:hypothetical protein